MFSFPPLSLTVFWIYLITVGGSTFFGRRPGFYSRVYDAKHENNPGRVYTPQPWPIRSTAPANRLGHPSKRLTLEEALSRRGAFFRRPGGACGQLPVLVLRGYSFAFSPCLILPDRSPFIYYLLAYQDHHANMVLVCLGHLCLHLYSEPNRSEDFPLFFCELNIGPTTHQSGAMLVKFFLKLFGQVNKTRL